jgi:hypothetical protein
MTFPIVVEASDGQFTASLVGVPTVRVIGSTRSQAIDGLKKELEHRVARGELQKENVGLDAGIRVKDAIRQPHEGVQVALFEKPFFDAVLHTFAKEESVR